MRDGIHPAYHEINIIQTDGATYKTKSTKGKAGDTWRLDIDSKSHPAWTGGEQKLMHNDQVDKYTRRFGAFTGAPAKEAKAEDKKSA